MRRVLNIALLTILTLTSVSVAAKDLGKVGETYPIKEMDLLDFIQTRLKQMQQSGELEKINNQIIAKAKTRFDRPIAVKGLLPTKTTRQWFIDPSIMLKDDITDIQGKVIVKAGTIVNPLTHVSLKSTFIFYDADSKAQVAWAIRQDKRLNGKTKLILINGSIIEQAKLFKRRVLFDQNGMLVKKFELKHTPAIVSQEGLKLKIEEVIP